jgi:thiamine biosynthesis lipoprotein
VIERRSFRAMGTQIELLVEAGEAEAALDAAETEFHRLEALLSRFRPDSELSRLNAAGRLEAGPDLLHVVALALDARRQTGGRFDPAVHDALVTAGYDRSFEDVPPEGPLSGGASSCGGEVALQGRTIVLGAGVRLDLGGIGKGYAAEQAAMLLAAAGPCLVDAGGDVAVRGRSWPVGVETGNGSLTLELGPGGLATSGRDRRRWKRGGRELHHLIDPATGTSAETDLLRVTVVASDAVEAEVWAKALFLAGREAAAADADMLGLPAVLVGSDGGIRLAGGLA